MSLSYLSGDDSIAGKKKSGGGGGSKRGGTKRTKPEKKQARKRVFKKVAKVAVAPARAAFLTVVSLNALKVGTKMARVYNQDNGPATLQKFWTGFGGDFTKLKKAIAKGSKQTINADEIGVISEAVIATATPIIIALVPILKQFKAGGDKKEAKEFNDGVEEGKKTLADDDDVPKAKTSMPRNKDVGIVADKNGDSVEDPKTDAGQPESKSGGSDSESGGGSAKDDDTETATNGKSMTKSEAEKTMSSTFSPLGFFSMILMYSMLIHTTNANLLTVIKLFCTYSLIAIVLIPVALMKRKNIFQRIAYSISFAPFNFITNQFNKISWLRK